MNALVRYKVKSYSHHEGAHGFHKKKGLAFIHGYDALTETEIKDRIKRHVSDKVKGDINKISFKEIEII